MEKITVLVLAVSKTELLIDWDTAVLSTQNRVDLSKNGLRFNLISCWSYNLDLAGFLLPDGLVI